MKKLLSALIILSQLAIGVFAVDMSAAINAEAGKVLPQVIEWRRHLHQYPELGNREFKTAEFIEKQSASAGFGSSHQGCEDRRGGNFERRSARRDDRASR